VVRYFFLYGFILLMDYMASLFWGNWLHTGISKHGLNLIPKLSIIGNRFYLSLFSYYCLFMGQLSGNICLLFAVINLVFKFKIHYLLISICKSILSYLILLEFYFSFLLHYPYLKFPPFFSLELWSFQKE